MNIYGTSKMTVISKDKQKSKDGTKDYYKLGVLIGSEAGMISCPEEVSKLVEVGKTYDFTTAYNDQYKSFRLTDALPCGK